VYKIVTGKKETKNEVEGSPVRKWKANIKNRV
jgi:hypothetical protein